MMPPMPRMTTLTNQQSAAVMQGRALFIHNRGYSQ